LLRAGPPNPRHLSTPAYLALGRAAAHRGARRNGAGSARVHVAFPGGGFAPTRVRVSLRGSGDVRLAAGRRAERVGVHARATAELVPDGDLGASGLSDGGGYSGPLAYRQGMASRPLGSSTRAANRRRRERVQAAWNRAISRAGGGECCASAPLRRKRTAASSSEAGARGARLGVGPEDVANAGSGWPVAEG
jgi:hypothetical protein